MAKGHIQGTVRNAIINQHWKADVTNGRVGLSNDLYSSFESTWGHTQQRVQPQKVSQHGWKGWIKFCFKVFSSRQVNEMLRVNKTTIKCTNEVHNRQQLLNTNIARKNVTDEDKSSR